MRGSRTLVVVLAVALSAAACSSSDRSASPAGDSGSVSTSTASTSPSTTSPSTSSPSTSGTTGPAAGPTTWLCRPGLADNPCEASRDATAVQGDGTRTLVSSSTIDEPPVDCFYVYPTVSKQPGPNATLAIDPEERQVAIAQASRFSAVCRVYAPMYRQLTLSALGGNATAANRAIAYGDVQAAWDDYLAHDNKGRGVVLIGHSQGAGMLDALVKARIDNDPVARKKLVSALLIGGNVLVPKGKDVGQDFQHVPACRDAGQVGCVVAYSTFDQAPPENSLFGRPRVATDGAEVLCTNPAALGGGSAPLHPYFPVSANLDLAKAALSGMITGLTTPWVTFPDLWSASCSEENGANVLRITDVRSPGDTRPTVVDSLGPTWGLHLLDVNLPLGDLVDLVGAQARAYTGAA